MTGAFICNGYLNEIAREIRKLMASASSSNCATLRKRSSMNPLNNALEGTNTLIENEWEILLEFYAMSVAFAIGSNCLI